MDKIWPSEGGAIKNYSIIKKKKQKIKGLLKHYFWLCSLKSIEKLNVVAQPGFNGYIVNELHQNVQNFHWVITDILVKTGINTPIVHIS